jgi:hypothetical protein
LKQLLLVNKFNTNSGHDLGEIISIHHEAYVFCVDQKFNHDVVFITDEKYYKIRDEWIELNTDGGKKMIYDHETKEIYFKDI